MEILAEAWQTWTTPDMIRKAARRCGIAENGLDIAWMQQDKFERAAAIIQSRNDEPNSSTCVVGSPVGVRAHSAAYYKFKYEESERLRRSLMEEEVQIEKIPGLLSIQKVVPKPTEKVTRVTQVHGSIRGSDILTAVEKLRSLEKERQEKREDQKDKKRLDMEAFLKCRDRCVCLQKPCLAANLKQCSSCFNVLKSQCSKLACRQDGSKPVMIRPTSTAPPKRCRKRLDTEGSESHGDLEDMVLLSESDSEDSDSDSESDLQNAISAMKKTWLSVSPPVQEEDVKGKFFGVIFENYSVSVGQSRRQRSAAPKKLLYIGRLLKRFLSDEAGEVIELEIDCLKLNTGSSCVLEQTPEHLPDRFLCKIEDVIAGPLEVEPVQKSRSFLVPDYLNVILLFNIVKDINRKGVLSQG